MEAVITLFIFLSSVFLGSAIYLLVRNRKIEKMLMSYMGEYTKLLSQKKSSEIRVGQIAEHLAPFLDEFKYDPKKARFIGNPIDYVVFEDDKIVFVEVKSGESRLTKGQSDIRDMILNGKVEFETMKIK